MFDNLLLITIIIMAMWLGMIVYYLITSRQQSDLQQNIESLRSMLDKSEQ